MDDAAHLQQGLAWLVKPMEEMLIAANAAAASPTQGSDPNPPALAPAPAPQAGAFRTGQALICPQCNSSNNKFCYYDNSSLLQPRYFCKTCHCYWTGERASGFRMKKRVSWSPSAAPAPASAAASASATSSSMASTAGVVLPKNPKPPAHVGGRDLHMVLFGGHGLLAPDPEFAAFPGPLESSNLCSLHSGMTRNVPAMRMRKPIVFRDLRTPEEKAGRLLPDPSKRLKKLMPVIRSRNAGVAGGATGGAGDGNSSHTQFDSNKLEQGGGGGGSSGAGQDAPGSIGGSGASSG